MNDPQQPTIVLVDGEHYPPVVARAITQLKAQGVMPLLALLVGGSEKSGQVPWEIGVPLEQSLGDPEAALASAIDRTGATRVIDLSDEPVLGYEMRCRLASVALWKNADYLGADFEFTPPPRPGPLKVPSMAVIGTGKRSGKTSIGATAARLLRSEGFNPVVVAMGRGGPAEPQILPAGADLSPKALLNFVAEGRHAASDYIEDALMSGAPTVGAWRAGGGMAGGVSFTNYDKAVEAALELDPGMLLLEGSGSALPPICWHSGLLVVDARIDPGHLCGYFGLYRLLLVDLVVLTMCEQSIDSGHLDALDRCIRRSTLNQPTAVRTVFRPYPLGEVSGKKIWLATTASEQAADVLKDHLIDNFEAEVVGVSNSLADRSGLMRDLRQMEKVGAETLVVELKAAAVDVATKHALKAGIEVVYLDNRPQAAAGEEKEITDELFRVAQLAKERCG